MNKNDNRYTPALFLLLLLIAALPRFYQLDALGFYGDEETSALAARALAEGKGMVMPTGMPYLRAMPQTLLNALSAKLFGLDQEYAYRIPAAIAGTLTVPLLFLLARPFVGLAVALLAALLLAFSEWHIITSREARMYAPFLLFYLATAFTLLKWNLDGRLRHAVLAFALFACAATLHPLAIMAVQFAAIPLAFPGWSRLKPLPVVIFIVLAGAASYLYSQTMEFSPYDVWKQAQGAVPPPEATDETGTASALPLVFEAPAYLAGLLLATGALLGLWLARLTPSPDAPPVEGLRKTARFALAGLAGALFCAGQLHAGAMAALVFLAMHRGDRGALLASARLPLLLIALITGAVLAIAASQQGPVTALKNALLLPYPYLSYFAEISPGLFLVFVLTSALLLLRKPVPGDIPFKALLLAFFLPLIALGIESKWGGTRYLIGSYPFFLLIAATGIVFAAQWLAQRAGLAQPRPVVAGAMVLALSGILGGHGLPQAITANQLDYGEPVNRHALGMNFYPDHQGAGRYVREHLQAGDLVIAEDMLEQYWYAGKVDYWLIDTGKSWQYLYRDENGNARDIYVGSEVLTADKLARLATLKRRIWLITSGEHAPDRQFTLNRLQTEWLESIEKDHPPVFVGRDNATRVYCIHC